MSNFRSMATQPVFSKSNPSYRICRTVTCFAGNIALHCGFPPAASTGLQLRVLEGGEQHASRVKRTDLT